LHVSVQQHNPVKGIICSIITGDFTKEEHLGRRTFFDDSGWRVIDLPHDWSIEDLPGRIPHLMQMLSAR